MRKDLGRFWHPASKATARGCFPRAQPVEVPEGMDGSLFEEGEYTLEVLRGKLSRLKLRERDQEALAGMAEQG